MSEKTHGLRPREIALALGLVFSMSGCGGGGGGNVKSTPTPAPANDGSAFRGGEISVGTGSTVNWSAAISGPIDLIKIGGGTLKLTGADTYTGGTAIKEGVLQIGGGGTTGSISGDVVDSALLQFDHSDDLTFAGTISGSGSLEQAGSGTLVLTAANTYAGGTTISHGTLQLGNGGTNGLISGDVVDNGTLRFDHSDDLTFTGTISGSGSLEQAGLSTLTLTGNNTYTGPTLVDRGTLQLGNGGTTGQISGDVVDNGTLRLDRGNDLTLTGAISGTGSLEQTGSGTLILTGANTYAGGTTISHGVLQLGNGGTNGQISGNVVDNSALRFDRSDTLTFNNVISGSGSLEQAGSGTLILTGANTYAGGTTISYGTLQLGNGGTTGLISDNVVDNGALRFDRSDALTFNNVVSGSGSLEQAGSGTLILTGANTYTGGTTISYGTLQLGNGGTTGLISGNVLDNGTLRFDHSDDLTFAGVISGTGSLEHAGASTLTLTGDNTFLGPTLVNSGTLQIGDGGTSGSLVGDVTNNGSVVFNREGDLTYAGIISGTGSFQKQGVDHLTLTGASTFSGGAWVREGILEIAPGGKLGTGNITVGDQDSPTYSGQTLKVDAGVTLGNRIVLNTFGTLDNAGALGGSFDKVVTDNGSESAIFNHDGGSIKGTGQAVSVFNFLTVDNRSGGVIEGQYGAIQLNARGNVSNDGVGSTIRATAGIAIAALGDVSIDNTGGGVIDGLGGAIHLQDGGTVNNGSGSTITTSGQYSIFVAPVHSSPSINGGLKLINAGTIVGSVQTDPAASNSAFLMSGSTIQGDLDLGSNSQSVLALDGDSGTIQSYSTAVTGTTTFNGTLAVNGSGTWTIDNDELQAVSDTMINTSATLHSTRVLAGNVEVFGTLEHFPGVAGSISNGGRVLVSGGDSTVGGGYVDYSNGTLAVSLGSKLVVSLNASLNGGTLEVTGADAGYVSNTHTAVLTAAGGVSGTFGKLVVDSGVVFTDTTIHYDTNSVWLDTTGLNVTTAAAGSGVNYTPASIGSAVRVQGAFQQLDNKFATGDLSGVSADFLRSAGEFQQAPDLQSAQASLRSLSGQLHAVSAAMTLKAIDASSRALSDRFHSLLGKGVKAGAWMQDQSTGGGMARAGFDGVDYQLNGWLVGNDRQVGSSGVAGFAFGQSQGSQWMSQGGDRDRTRNIESMLYAGWLRGNWYTEGRVGFGHFQQDVDRRLLLGYSAQAVSTRYGGRYGVAYGESGLYFDCGRTHVEPFASVEYARIGRDGFAEQGAGGFGLRTSAQVLDRWQGAVGVRASHRWDFSHGRAVDFSAHAQWQNTLAARGDVFDASFVGLQQWQPLVGIGLSRYSGLIGVGLDATLSPRTALKFSYDYEHGQRDSAQAAFAHLDIAL